MLNASWKYFPELETFRCLRVERLPEPEIRIQTWSDEEIEAVLKELLRPAQLRENAQPLAQRRSVAELFIICLETGMRAGEARTFRKSQINFNRGVINVTSYKGKRQRLREVTMNDTVMEILKRRAEVGDNIFPSIVDPAKPMSTYAGSFGAACERAKVKYGRGLEGALVFYDARKTFENNALDRGESPAAIARHQGTRFRPWRKAISGLPKTSAARLLRRTRNTGHFWTRGGHNE
jgi:integrase